MVKSRVGYYTTLIPDRVCEADAARTNILKRNSQGGLGILDVLNFRVGYASTENKITKSGDLPFDTCSTKGLFTFSIVADRVVAVIRNSYICD